MSLPYQVLPPTAPVPAPDDVLERLVREGARKLLQAALEEEVDEFLGRRRYQRTDQHRGYRNGHLPKRTIGVGMGAVEIKLPRVSDVPPEVSPGGFHSEIVAKYQRRSRTQARLLARLYLEGLASGDFEPVFRALVGETAALSPSSILKLKADWQQEYEAWKKRPLRGRYVYLYADGFYLKAGPERDKTAVLVVLGVDEQGHKELLAMDEGYRESTASWSEVLRSLKERGVTDAPLLAIGDGALGLWAALDEVFPTTRQQRCWNHRALNVVDKLPKRLQPEIRKELHALAEAPTRQECERRRDQLCARLRAQRQAAAADCLERDWDDFVTFFDFPQEHWIHLRTSNPIESIFSGVRLRTDASKRLHVRENALYLVFKLVVRLSLNWRGINAPNQLRLLLAGHHFRDGQLVLDPADPAQLAQAVGA
ncbi:MAG: IS256 family transposase [Chloroflexota bacterium]|nr:IS256 family transposase [Chloroflexota bacterium]